MAMMGIRGGWRRAVACVALAAVLGAASATSFVTPAKASNADACSLQGAGTISPGLLLTPTAQSLSLSGNETCTGTDGIASTSEVSGSGSCLDAAVYVAVGCTLTISEMVCHLVMVAPDIWQWICDFFSNPTGDEGEGEAVSVPQQTPPAPITSFSFAGTAVWAFP